jgi:prefoldin subunit 5
MDDKDLELIKREIEIQKEYIEELRNQVKELMELKETLKQLIGQIQGAKWAIAVMVAIGSVFIAFFGLFSSWVKR